MKIKILAFPKFYKNTEFQKNSVIHDLVATQLKFLREYFSVVIQKNDFKKFNITESDSIFQCLKSYITLISSLVGSLRCLFLQKYTFFTF